MDDLQTPRTAMAVDLLRDDGERLDGTPVIDKENEKKEQDQNDPTTRGPPSLKYTYGIDQWSPLNKSGKKVYDREFLIKLKGDPNSKIKPSNLPDLEVVLKDNSRSIRGSMDLRQFKDMGRHDFLLFPGFVKSSQSARGVLPPRRGSRANIARSNQRAYIHAQSVFNQDIELRRTANPWTSMQPKFGDPGQEDIPAENIHKTVRGVLNKLMPQTFNKLVNQVKALRIESKEILQGLVDLVFEKAINEPRFMAVYAPMCKELSMMQVSVAENEAGEKKDSKINFRKLIITRCVMEFERAVDENAEAIQKREIEAIAEMGKESQRLLTEDEKKNRRKSLGVIRFIGELFKQQVLTTFITHKCIQHLLRQIDDESLECLCTLLNTVGKVLESKNENLELYFKRIMEIVDRKVSHQVSSRVRFMLRDVIELRNNNWIPRKSNSNTEMKDKVEMKVKTENEKRHNEKATRSHLVRNQPQDFTDDIQSTVMIALKKVSADIPKTETSETTSSEQKEHLVSPILVPTSTTSRDRGSPEHKWSPFAEYLMPQDVLEEISPTEMIAVEKVSADTPKTETLETTSSKKEENSLSPILVPTSTTSGDRGGPEHKLSCSSQSAISEPSLIVSEEETLADKSDLILEDYLYSDPNISNTTEIVREAFHIQTINIFVREILSRVINKSATSRKQVGKLMTNLISDKVLPLRIYLSSLEVLSDISADVKTDDPEIWIRIAELLCDPLVKGVHPFYQLSTTMSSWKSKGLAGKMMAELIIVLAREMGEQWVRDSWGSINWTDFIQPNESLFDFITKYKLEFTFKDSSSYYNSDGLPNMKEIQKRLRGLMYFNEKKQFCDSISCWISANLGERAKDPEFIKVLITAILELTFERHRNTWRFRLDKFQDLQVLIPPYVDDNINLAELQCLLANQEYIHQSEHPQRVLLQILEKQIYESILSFDVYDVWESEKDPTPRTRRSAAMLAVKSFYTSLKGIKKQTSTLNKE